jgi:hypothetical protein
MGGIHFTANSIVPGEQLDDFVKEKKFWEDKLLNCC